MNNRQLNYPNSIDTDLNSVSEKRGSLNFSGEPNIILENNRVTDMHYLQQLQVLKEHNSSLEETIEQRTNELMDVVATNAKFISLIAHDLRGPFHSILGALELLRHSMRHNKITDVEGYIDIASNSANRTLNLLDDLLTWTISQNKEKSFNPARINLLDLVREELDLVGMSGIQKQINLNTFIPGNLFVNADIHMVKTIIRNLIGNAIKFTNPGGEIAINAVESDPFIEISIKDNGVGISYETQKKLFQIGAFQSSPGTNSEKGTGLGLLICKEFVEMHAGNIEIESEPGKGCETKFTLPHYL